MAVVCRFIDGSNDEELKGLSASKITTASCLD